MLTTLLLCIALCCCSGLVSSADVNVNSLGDAAPNASQCLPAQAANNACTLRSAFSFCALNFSSSVQCHIVLPAFGRIEMNSSLGQIDIQFQRSVTNNVELILEGSGATVTLDSASLLSTAPLSGLVSLQNDARHDMKFQIQNMSFVHFTESVFNLNNVDVVIEDSQFVNNSAENGTQQLISCLNAYISTISIRFF